MANLHQEKAEEATEERRQSVGVESEPPPINLPISGIKVEKGLPGSREIETEKTTKEKLVKCLEEYLPVDEKTFRDLLLELGLNPVLRQGDVRKTIKFFQNRKNEVLGKMADALVEYVGEKEIKEHIGKGNFQEFMIDYLEDMEKVIKKEIMNCYEKILESKKDKERLAEKQKGDLDRIRQIREAEEEGQRIAEQIMNPVEESEGRRVGSFGGTEIAELEGRIRKAVDDRLEFVLERISSLTDEQKKALGINEAELRTGIDNLKNVELPKIYKWCQDKFGGPLKDEVADPEKFKDWINYYVDSAFTVHGNEAMRKAYGRAFARMAIPKQETVEGHSVQFSEDEERFLNFYLKKYQEDITSFFGLIRSDKEIGKFKKNLLDSIKKTRRWAIKRGFEEKKANVLKERLEREAIDFFEEKKKEEKFIPISEQMDYIQKMMDFLEEFSEGMSRIVKERKEEAKWTIKDTENQLKSVMEELLQKFYIGKKEFNEMFKEEDIDKLTEAVVEKFSKRIERNIK